MTTERISTHVQRHAHGTVRAVRSDVPVVFVGEWDGVRDQIFSVFSSGFDVRIEHRIPVWLSSDQPLVVGIALDNAIHYPILQKHGHAWFGWNKNDDANLALCAYQFGAQAVLPSVITSEVMITTIQRLASDLLRGSAIGGNRDHASERSYERGQFVIPDEHAILEVIDGILAVTVIHHDGAEVLLGLCGPGQILVGHPEDNCSIRLVAHTPATIRSRSWVEATRDPDLPLHIRGRLQQMEAWAAMQARPHLDQRILGLLSLLAEQFGIERDGKMIINVRITHQQLAAAVGATRTTVTRILRDLKRSGLITTTGNGNAERYCLLDWQPHRH
jgi:hypothetical protein